MSPEERFNALFAATHQALLAYALRRVQDPADAADVVADTFLVAWRRIDEVPTGDDARPWLFGVARRVLANLHRGDRRRSALSERLRENLIGVAQPLLVPDDSLTRAIATLSPDDQELLRLLAWEQLTRDEIAAVMGLSQATVRVRLYRARRRLESALEAEGTSNAAAEVSKTLAVKRIPTFGHVMTEPATADSTRRETL